MKALKQIELKMDEVTHARYALKGKFIKNNNLL